MGKECLVIRKDDLVKRGFIPESVNEKYFYTKIECFSDLKNFLRLAAFAGAYQERFGANGVETNPSFQQAIMYGFVLKDSRFLIYQRDQGGKYEEKRLAGKVSVGIGGHMEKSDLSLPDSFYREVNEEAQITINGRPNDFFSGGNLNVRLMKSFIEIVPRGFIKDERDEVGKVHFGVVCQIVPKREEVEIKVRTGSEEENVSGQYITIEEYQVMVSLGQITPEGWTDIVFREEILPRVYEKKERENLKDNSFLVRQINS